MIALDHEKKLYSLNQHISLERCLKDFVRYASLNGKIEFELNIDILDKRAKHHYHIQKMLKTEAERKKLDHPSNPPVEQMYYEHQKRQQWQEGTSQVLSSIKKSKKCRERNKNFRKVG